MVDRVVVVDGGSTDGSVELLLDWVEHDPKVEIISNEMTHWGKNFAWQQSTLNMQIGHDTLRDCDWIVRVDADHVLDTRNSTNLWELLTSCCEDKVNVSFPVYYFRNGKYHMRKAPRNWIINNKRASLLGLNIGWGKDEETGMLSDSPLIVHNIEYFVDPELHIQKPSLIGRRLHSEYVCPIPVYRYGHFFFTKEQAIQKCYVWDRAVTKFSGKRCKTRFEILVDADVLGIVDYMTKEELLSLDHPPEIKRVINEFYEPGMLGGAKYIPGVRYVSRLVVRMLHGWHKISERVRA